jgi:hypothetical protein
MIEAFSFSAKISSGNWGVLKKIPAILSKVFCRKQASLGLK